MADNENQIGEFELDIDDSALKEELELLDTSEDNQNTAEQEYKEQKQQYYQENKEKRLEYDKEYREQKKEELKQYRRDYYAKNKEPITDVAQPIYMERGVKMASCDIRTDRWEVAREAKDKVAAAVSEKYQKRAEAKAERKAEPKAEPKTE